MVSGDLFTEFSLNEVVLDTWLKMKMFTSKYLKLTLPPLNLGQVYYLQMWYL